MVRSAVLWSYVVSTMQEAVSTLRWRFARISTSISRWQRTGATWLDRRLVAREGVELSRAGFGAEVRAALDRRIDTLAEQGLARRDGDKVTIGRNLIGTLRSRELDAVGRRLASETGLGHLPTDAGEHVTGNYRRRLSLASGRFAMIVNGLGFQLVPWIPSLERELGRHVNGIAGPGGS